MFDNKTIDYLDQLNSAQNLAELDQAIGLELSKLGDFQYFFGRYDPYRPDDLIWIDHRHEEWVKLYRATGYFYHDPVNYMAALSSQAFFWDAAFRNQKLSAEQQKMTAIAWEFGLKDGLCLPVPGANNARSIFSLCSHDIDHFRQSIRETGTVMETLLRLSIQRMEAILGLTASANQPRLTPREREVLTWAAAGKSNDDIAVIIGISKGTVGTHIKSAANKLGAHTKMQAVARAASLHLILV